MVCTSQIVYTINFRPQFHIKISHLAPRLRKRRTKEVNYSSLNLIAISFILFRSALESRVELLKGFVLFSFLIL